MSISRNPTTGIGSHRVQPISSLDDYDRASPAVDCVLITIVDGSLAVLIHRRSQNPFAGKWALPGVFVHFGESYERAAERALRDKGGVARRCYKEQLEARNEPNRDPRGWVVTVAYLLLARQELIIENIRSAGDAELAFIESVSGHDLTDAARIVVGSSRTAVELAFDHDELVRSGIRRLQAQIWYTALSLEFVPEAFTLRDLQAVFEAILGVTLNRASFRRHVLEVVRLVEPTGETQTNVGHRPAALYKRGSEFGSAQS